MNEWTISKLIEWTTQHFSSKGIESARLDGELLLAHTLKCKRIDLYLKFDAPVSELELKAYKELVLRRAKREPVAYILGRQEFYNRAFEVSVGVLIPRPETEHLVEAALEWAKNRDEATLLALDVGCGSGAISVSVAAEQSKFSITALDISTMACDVTRINSENNKVAEKIKIQNIDFLTWSSGETFDLVMSNPPYIGRNTLNTIKADVLNFEPSEALFGGDLGDETLKLWIPKMTKALNPKGLLLCEIGYDQELIAKQYCEETSSLENIEVLKDYSGHPRVLRAFKKAEA